ncbi:MAG TPA: hypothetical protein VFH17_02835 [Coriobacteriia bacterium]|nr:hypothetical protein [Coriobacteriia bacterium]
MSLGTVPALVWWIAGILIAFVSALAVYVLARWAYGVVSRRYLVHVVSRREGVRASCATLEAVVRDFEDAPDRLAGPLSRSAAEDRKTLIDLACRMEIVTEELDTMPLPRSLWPSASALADAAYIIAEEARRVGESDDTETIRSGLGQVDTRRAAEAFTAADTTVRDASQRYKFDESVVYGGGLYI